MKLSTAFDGMARENYFLKLVVKCLLVVTVALLGIVYNLYDRIPLIVERGSRGLEIVNATEFSRKDPDLKRAITLMLHARLDSGAVSPELFLNQKQLALRDAEQKDIKARGMSQDAFVRGITFERDQAIVDIDRLIAIGEVRSALRARIKVTFEETSPNELNPYGLLLSLADPVETKETK
jgi:hypothetical protein